MYSKLGTPALDYGVSAMLLYNQTHSFPIYYNNPLKF